MGRRPGSLALAGTVPPHKGEGGKGAALAAKSDSQKQAQQRNLPVARSLDEMFSMLLRVVHEMAASRGVTPQTLARELLQVPFPYVPRSALRDAGLMPDTDEYRQLRGWLTELLYQYSQEDLAIAQREKKRLAKSGTKGAAGKRRAGLNTTERVKAQIAALIKKSHEKRDIASTVARRLGLSASYVRRIGKKKKT